MKVSGFKPIGNASSSIKKFFPGDEEDMDTSEERHDHSIVNTQTQSLSTSRASSSFARANGDDHIPETSRSMRDLAFEAKRDLKPVELPESNVSPAWNAPLAESASTATVTDVNETQISLRVVKLPSTADLPFSSMDNQDVPTDVLSAASHKDLYRIINQVGEGTFGKVYKAQNTLNGGHVALKRIRMESEKDGFPVTAMREIKLLQSLRHENVVRLYEMMVSRGKNDFLSC
jgi:CTD kinase subunit alpha